MATSTPWSPICARCRRRNDGSVSRPCNTSFAPAWIPAHDVVDVGRREIIGDDVARGSVRPWRVHAARQNLRQRKAKAVACLQRLGLALQLVLAERRNAGNRDDLAGSGRIEIK